jgi:hypothetical protein
MMRLEEPLPGTFRASNVARGRDGGVDPRRDGNGSRSGGGGRRRCHGGEDVERRAVGAEEGLRGSGSYGLDGSGDVVALEGLLLKCRRRGEVGEEWRGEVTTLLERLLVVTLRRRRREDL